MENLNNDGAVIAHIKNLTEKEEHLYLKKDLSEEDMKALHQIKTELDQYWDLLRQRRALRDAGRSPEKAAIRPVDQVENYEE